MKKLPVYIIISSAALWASCQKRDPDGFDSSKLSIELSKPSEAQVFRKGDTVFIRAAVSYTNPLHGYALVISNKNTGKAYLETYQHVQDAVFSIDTYWKDTLSQEADLLLKLTVEADHDGHEKTKEINFKSQP